jgi:hypothetical protein
LTLAGGASQICELPKDHNQGHYSDMSGSTWSETFMRNGYSYAIDETLSNDTSIISGHYSNSDGDDYDMTNDFVPVSIAQEEGTLTAPPDRYGTSYNKSSTVKMTLHTGGKSQGGKRHLFTLGASATEELAEPSFGEEGSAIPCPSISVAGHDLDSGCTMREAFQDGIDVDVTPQVGAPMYSFTVGLIAEDCAPVELTFEDAPYRLFNYSYPLNPATWPWQWSATLSVVCNVGDKYPGDSIPSSLASITYGFTMDTNGTVTLNPPSGDTNQIVIISFIPNVDDSGGGIDIEAYYIGCCDDGSLNWVQTLITNSVPQDSQTVPTIDCYSTNFPFYFGPGGGTMGIDTHTSDYP